MYYNSNNYSIELFIKLAMTVFFKRKQHRKLSWLDKDSDKNQSQFDELFNRTHVSLYNEFVCKLGLFWHEWAN
jgi:hypothetical protein